MSLPLFLASGQGVIPFIFIGLPAALGGVVCLTIALVFALRRREEERKARCNLAIAGALLLLTLLSPTLDPIVLPLFERLSGR